MDHSRKRKQIFVVSGSHSEYTEVLERKRKEYFVPGVSMFTEVFPDYIYVSNVDILRGRSEIEGFYCGTYWSRPDLEEIRFVIETIKAKALNGNN